MMKAPLRFVLILGMVSITGALVTQIFWLQKALQVKAAGFDQTVLLSLRRVAEHIDYSYTSTFRTLNAVTEISNRKYKLDLNDTIDCNVLDYWLRTELAYPSLNLDFEYHIYDSRTDSLLYSQTVDMGHEEKLYAIHNELPVFNKGPCYTIIYFPTRSEYIGVKMTIWIFSSLVLLIAVFFFAYTVFVILRQIRLMQMQKDFINNMAHEFKTPISTINISAETLSNPSIIHEPLRLANYATIIRKESERLRTQVDKLLQLAKMERDKVDLHLEEIDLHALIREVIPTFAFKLEEESSLIAYHLEAEEHVIRADRVHLTNIIYNLLDNALKYTEKAPEIELKTENTNGMLRFSVRDNGIGIPKEFHDKVFAKFFRVPTGNIHNVKGFGLGLHYLRLIVNAHKWNLTLDSEPGQGSCFAIEIPIIHKTNENKYQETEYLTG